MNPLWDTSPDAMRQRLDDLHRERQRFNRFVAIVGVVLIALAFWWIS